MVKNQLFGCAIAALASLAAQAQNQSYFTDNLGEVNGVSDNGRYVAIGDTENNHAYLWDSNNSNVFTDISADPALTANRPSAQRVVGSQAYDVTDDGSMVVGMLLYADGHSTGAYYKDGVWTPLPLHPASLNTTEAIAVTPDGKTIGGYSFISDVTSEIAGRYYPVQWILNDAGVYELHAYTDIELPDHQGFMPLTQSPDGKAIAGTLYCAVQSNIPALVIDGQLKIFNELTEKSEPWIFRGKYYCGTDENGKQIWSDDPNDPRIVLFTESYIDGFKDSETAVEGSLAFCDNDGNFYGMRTLITNVDENGGGTLRKGATIYNVNTDTWTDNFDLSFYTAGVGQDLMFANDGIVMIDGKRRYIQEEYGIESPRPIAGINKISMNGKVLGGLGYEINPASGEYQYFPFVTVLEGAFSGIKTVYGGSDRPSFIVSRGTILLRNAESMDVYDLNGRLVASGASASVAPGIYVVKSGDTSAKVLVK